MHHPALRHIRNTLIAALGLSGCIEDAPSIAEPPTPDAALFDGRVPRPDAEPDRGPTLDARPADALADTGPDAMVDAAPDAMPPPPAPPCIGEPIPGADGQPSGYVQCASGGIDRVGPARCAPQPWAGACDPNAAPPGFGACAVDANCVAGAFGRCGLPDFPTDGGCQCFYGCAADTDCGPDQICVCGGLGVGGPASGASCQPAHCAGPEDCASGRCGLSRVDYGCGIEPVVACRTADDECEADPACADVDCDGPFGCLASCWPAGQLGARAGDDRNARERWHCDEPDAVCGRPLRVASATGYTARVAPARSRDGWQTAADAIDTRGLSAADRARLAAHWTTIGALEHASVASFARFSMQLMALGAPADLLADCQRAAADEVEHARMAYGIAAHFAGHGIGPGSLSLDGITLDHDPATVLREVIIEGCVGETLAAAEAAEATRLSADPIIAAVCARIAEDELRHAALGWRTAQWLLACHPELAPVASNAFDDAYAHHIDGIAPASDGVVDAYGIPARGALRRAAWADVITPTLARLVG